MTQPYLSSITNFPINFNGIGSFTFGQSNDVPTLIDFMIQHYGVDHQGPGNMYRLVENKFSVYMKSQTGAYWGWCTMLAIGF